MSFSFSFVANKKRKKRTKRKRKHATASYALTSVEQNGCSGFSVGRKPVRANNMEITRKIRKDLLLLECYARPNNPRQGGIGIINSVSQSYPTYLAIPIYTSNAAL